jgi:hypothetical protein
MAGWRYAKPNSKTAAIIIDYDETGAQSRSSKPV